MYKAVFLRHGQSIWNKKGLFTGWVDIGLSEEGKKQAKKACRMLKKQGFVFDLVFCSDLKRAKKTLEIILEEMGRKDVVITKYKYSRELRERHYGALQGINKKEAVKKFGYEQTFQWRRSFITAPPKDSNGFSESLQDTQDRVLSYWQKEIVPAIKSGKKVFVCSHGSVMRALVKYFENMSDKDVENLNIPLALPLVYEFDENMRSMGYRYLAREEQVAKAVGMVRSELK